MVLLELLTGREAITIMNVESIHIRDWVRIGGGERVVKATLLSLL